MKHFITHQSALEYWRRPSDVHVGIKHNPKRQKAPKMPTDTPSALQLAEVMHLTVPIDISVNNKSARRRQEAVRYHVAANDLPGNSVVSVRKGVGVSSPESCFLQMAEQLTLAELIALGLELCGSYSLYNHNEPRDNTSQGFYSRPPLTTIKKLAAFVSKTEGRRGHKKAERSLRYIGDNSASPQETILSILLTLPYNLGGYGLPMPKLNARIVPKGAAKLSSSKRSYYCDLYWPEYMLAVEYDSDTYHTGAERIASDSKRRNALSKLGIVVITVTNQQISNSVEFEKDAKQIASSMGKQLRHKRTPGFRDTQHQLRKVLRRR